MAKKAFTLIEIMIVLAVVALVATLAIPSYLRSRMSANEVAAISGLRTIASAAISYRTANNAYPENLAALSQAAPPYIDTSLAGGSKQGYDFVLSGAANSFSATAAPQAYQSSGVRSFFVDNSGVIHWTDQNAAASAADAAIQ